MSDILTKTIARAGQVVTLLGAAGFPVSQVKVTRAYGVEVHLAPDAPNRSAWQALAVTGMKPTRAEHFPDHDEPFTVAHGTYKGTSVLVFGDHEPECDKEAAA